MVENIKYILIGPGGPLGLNFYGSIKQCCKLGIINLDNIQAYFGISIGSIVSVMMLLKYDFDTLDDYIIKRPWHKAIKTDILQNIVNLYSSCGMYNRDFFITILQPLLKGKNLTIDITFKDFFEYNNTSLFIYATNMETMKYEEFSHITHPDVSLIDAIHASCSIPFIFNPSKINDTLYCDGALSLQETIDICIQKYNVENYDEICSIVSYFNNIETKTINTDNVLNMLYTWLPFIFNNKTQQSNNTIKHNYCSGNNNIEMLTNITSYINDSELRLKMINEGVKLIDKIFENNEIVSNEIL